MRDYEDVMGRGYFDYDIIGRQGYPREALVGRGYYPMVGADGGCAPFPQSNGMVMSALMPLTGDEAGYQQALPVPAVQGLQQPAFGAIARPPRRTLVGYLGFPRVEIEPGECVTTAVQAETTLKITRFVIDDNSAIGLLVDDIKAGRESILLGAGVPAQMFAPNSTVQDIIATETVQEGTTVSIALRNITKTKICVSVGASCRYWVY